MPIDATLIHVTAMNARQERSNVAATPRAAIAPSMALLVFTIERFPPTTATPRGLSGSLCARK